MLWVTDLDPDVVGDAGPHATHYEAVPVPDFRALMALVPKDAIPNATFVDVGAGMGRAVILAAEYPFKQAVGIEVSPALYEVAKENLAIAQAHGLRCHDIRLVRDDARIANYPPGDLVVFLFNPFDADALRTTLACIENPSQSRQNVAALSHTGRTRGIRYDAAVEAAKRYRARRGLFASRC